MFDWFFDPLDGIRRSLIAKAKKYGDVIPVDKLIDKAIRIIDGFGSKNFDAKDKAKLLENALRRIKLQGLNVDDELRMLGICKKKMKVASLLKMVSKEMKSAGLGRCSSMLSRIAEDVDEAMVLKDVSRTIETFKSTCERVLELLSDIGLPRNWGIEIDDKENGFKNAFRMVYSTLMGHNKMFYEWFADGRVKVKNNYSDISNFAEWVINGRNKIREAKDEIVKGFEAEKEFYRKYDCGEGLGFGTKINNGACGKINELTKNFNGKPRYSHGVALCERIHEYLKYERFFFDLEKMFEDGFKKWANPDGTLKDEETLKREQAEELRRLREEYEKSPKWVAPKPRTYSIEEIMSPEVKEFWENERKRLK